MIQKQKNQVKEYLSESYKSSELLHNLIPYPVLQHNNSTGSSTAITASKSQPATTCNSPIVKPNSSKLLNHVTMKNNNLLSQSANEMLHVQSVDSGQSASNNSFPFVLNHRYIAAASPSSAMSPTISSVATSASEVSGCWCYCYFCGLGKIENGMKNGNGGVLRFWCQMLIDLKFPCVPVSVDF